MAKDQIEQLIADFAASLSQLMEQRVRKAGGGNKVGAVAAGRSNRKPSPGRQLQGQYIGRLRKLKGSKRAQVQRLAQTKGVAAAVKLADKLIG
jgi:hypothetical protein